MKISVITVCYNAVSSLENTILSVINQTYNDLEYIIIDGGSTDGSVDIIKKYSSKIDFWISEPDKGIYDAMNKGIAHATGEWINFMNAGDEFYRNDVIAQIYEEKIPSTVKVVYGDVVLKKKEGIKPGKNFPISFLEIAMAFCHQSSFTRKTVCTFDTKFKIGADFKLFHDIYYNEGAKAFKYVPIKISLFENISGLSTSQIKQCRREWLQIRSHHKNLRWYIDLLKYQLRFNILRL